MSETPPTHKTSIKLEKSQTSKKSGSQREKDGKNYETAVEHFLKSFFRKNTHVKVEVISNLELYAKNFPELFKEIKANLNCEPWKSFVEDATMDFLAVEIDLALKITLLDPLGPQKSIFIPYDLKDPEVVYELDIGDAPAVVYLEITNNPHEFHKKLWQIEKIITLNESLLSQSQKGDLLKPISLIETEQTSKLETWRKWLDSKCHYYYSITSNRDAKIWLERFVSKLCIFNELSVLSGTIEFKPELEKDLLKLLAKNDVNSLVENYKNNKYLKENALEQTQVGKILREGKMLFLFIEASLDVILASVTAMETNMINMVKAYSEEILKIEEKHESQIKSLHEKIDSFQKLLNQLVAKNE